jgi:hypothetical protein
MFRKVGLSRLILVIGLLAVINPIVFGCSTLSDQSLPPPPRKLTL